MKDVTIIIHAGTNDLEDDIDSGFLQTLVNRKKENEKIIRSLMRHAPCVMRRAS